MLGIYNEVAEAGYLDFFSALETSLDDIECGLHHVGGIFFGKAHFLVDSRNDFRFSHFPPLAFLARPCLGPQLSAEKFADLLDQLLMQHIYFKIGQCPIVGSI